MRTRLRARIGTHTKYRATFACYGATHEARLTLGFLDLRDAKGSVLADHIWFTDARAFEHLKLVGGECVEFHASVRQYVRMDGTMDYGLVNVMYAKRVNS